MNKGVLLICSILLAFSLGAQQTVSLEEALQKAELNSALARQIHARYESNRWWYKAAQSNRGPQLSLNGNLPNYQRRINQVVQPDGTFQFIPVQQAYSNASLSLSQNLPFSGGVLSIQSNLSRGDIFGDQGSTFWQANPLLISLNQPLFRFNAQKWQWKQDKLRLQLATRLEAEQMEELRLSTIQAYFDWYVASLQLANAEYNTAINDTIYRISNGRFSVGKIAENELLQVELNFTNARNTVEQQRMQLALSKMRLEILTGPLAPDAKALPPSALPVIDPDPAKAREEALFNRSDILQNQLGVAQAQRSVREAQLARLPQSDINVLYGLNQTGLSLDQSLQSPVNSQFAGLGFSIPITSFGANRAQVKAGQRNLEASEAAAEYARQQMEVEVLGLALQMKQLRTSLDISAKADTIARKRYEVARNRYKIGTVGITDLSIAQNEKDQALVNYFESLRAYWLGYYRLRRLTLYDFAKGVRLYQELDAHGDIKK